MSNVENSSDKDYQIFQVRFTASDIPSFLEAMQKNGLSSGCRIVCFNRGMMAGKRHVESAVSHALRSFDSGNAIARRLEVEALLYAAGTRQTGLIGPFGIRTGENECYLCIIPASDRVFSGLEPLVGGHIDEDWEGMDPLKEDRLVRFFGITPAEIRICGREKIVDLILERVALLAVNS